MSACTLSSHSCAPTPRTKTVIIRCRLLLLHELASEALGRPSLGACSPTHSVTNKLRSHKPCMVQPLLHAPKSSMHCLAGSERRCAHRIRSCASALRHQRASPPASAAPAPSGPPAAAQASSHPPACSLRFGEMLQVFLYLYGETRGTTPLSRKKYSTRKPGPGAGRAAERPRTAQVGLVRDDERGHGQRARVGRRLHLAAAPHEAAARRHLVRPPPHARRRAAPPRAGLCHAGRAGCATARGRVCGGRAGGQPGHAR